MSGEEKKSRSSEGKLSSKVLLATVTFNRRALVEQALSSWLANFDNSLFTLVVIDNCSTDSTFEYLTDLANKGKCVAVRLKKNFGTAPALNLAWRLRTPHQHAVKADSDIVVHTKGVLQKMVEVADAFWNIGIIGLKRPDLIESPNHPDYFYRSKILNLKSKNTVYILEFVHHVMGSFQLYNKAALSDFGYLYQFQDEREGPAYGFDDALACFRMRALRKSVAFLRGWVLEEKKTSVEISHIDPGESSGNSFLSSYTRWKQKEAEKALPRYFQLAQEFLRAERNPYYDALWDFQAMKGEVEEVVGAPKELVEKVLEMV